MPAHVHTGGIQFLVWGLVIIIWMAIFRIIEMWLAHTPIGRGLAFIV